MVTMLPAGTAGRNRMAVLDREMVVRMSASLPAQTEECVMRTFGISVNTWVKLRDGKPIRPSVALRLLDRLQRNWNEIDD